MLSDLRRGRVNQEQDLFGPSPSPGPSRLPPHTQLGGVLARRLRGSGPPPRPPLLPRAAAALSPTIRPHQSEHGTPVVPDPGGRRTPVSGTGQRVASFLRQSRTRARRRLPAPLPPTVARLQPANTGDPEAHQPGSSERRRRRRREQEVGLRQPRGRGHEEVSQSWKPEPGLSCLNTSSSSFTRNLPQTGTVPTVEWEGLSGRTEGR